MTSARSSWASLLPLPAAVEEALPLPLALQWAHHAEQRSNACQKYIASVVNEEVLNALWTKIRDPIADIPTLPFVIRSSGCLRNVDGWHSVARYVHAVAASEAISQVHGMKHLVTAVTLHSALP